MASGWETGCVTTDENDALRDLRDRLRRANDTLLNMKHQTERLTGKAEGVRLALSYVDEALRTRVIPPAEDDALREALEQIRRYAALNFLGAAFDPEHMRAIANFCAGVLNGEPMPDDLAQAPEAYFLAVLRENGWTVIPADSEGNNQ